MTLNHDEKAREISRIIDAVYIHGTREGDNPGSRLDITALPEDEITIATALKSLNKLLKEVEEEAIERCAKIAENSFELNHEEILGKHGCYGGPDSCEYCCSDTIANAIRNQSKYLTVIPVNSQTSNKMEWQDSQANVLKEWRADGTVWSKGVYLGKAETLAEALLIIGNRPEQHPHNKER